MDALLGLLVLIGLPALTYWVGKRRGARSVRREHAARAAAMICQCGGPWSFHDPATGRCAHVDYGEVLNGTREVRECRCQRFVDAAAPYSATPTARGVAS